MERMKHISSAQNELYDRILTQYYMPLQLYVKAKDPKTVTLAEHTRLYKLGKLMETLSLSCQVGFTVYLSSGSRGAEGAMAPRPCENKS